MSFHFFWYHVLFCFISFLLYYIFFFIWLYCSFFFKNIVSNYYDMIFIIFHFIVLHFTSLRLYYILLSYIILCFIVLYYFYFILCFIILYLIFFIFYFTIFPIVLSQSIHPPSTADLAPQDLPKLHFSGYGQAVSAGPRGTRGSDVDNNNRWF